MKILYVAFIVAACGGGCMYRTARYSFRVIDTRANEPVPGADVQLVYRKYLDPFLPGGVEGTTDKDGCVTLKAVVMPSYVIVERGGLQVFSGTLISNGEVRPDGIPPGTPENAPKNFFRVDKVASK
jgi:hypothetical protein